jgi:hypothetical protein
MKDGYYVAIIAGGGGPTVLYSDGEKFWAHGSDQPLDPGFLEFIAAEPVDIMNIPGVSFVDPQQIR